MNVEAMGQLPDFPVTLGDSHWEEDGHGMRFVISSTPQLEQGCSVTPVTVLLQPQGLWKAPTWLNQRLYQQPSGPLLSLCSMPLSPPASLPRAPPLRGQHRGPHHLRPVWAWAFTVAPPLRPVSPACAALLLQRDSCTPRCTVDSGVILPPESF